MYVCLTYVGTPIMLVLNALVGAVTFHLAF